MVQLARFAVFATAALAARVDLHEADEGVSKFPIVATGIGGTTGVGRTAATYCLEVYGNDVNKNGQKVVMAMCNPNKASQQFSYNANGEARIQVGSEYKCLTQKYCKKHCNKKANKGKCLPSTNKKSGHPELTIEKCSPSTYKKGEQEWIWQAGEMTGSRQIKNKACAECMGIKYATTGGWGETLQVTAWKCGWKADKNTDFNYCNTKKKLGCDKV